MRNSEEGMLEIGEDGKKRLHSFSGNERNKLFLNTTADFADLSTLSGLDSPADGRAFAYWDFDRDGWTDVAVVNANNPLLNVYRNRIGEFRSDGSVVAIRFVGGNFDNRPSSEFSNRDGIGSKVLIEFGDGKRLYREYKCGEGFAAQNSATMLIGIDNATSVAKLTVDWPSGKSQSIEDVKEGMLLTAFENPAESKDQSGFDTTEYRNTVEFDALASKLKFDQFRLSDDSRDVSLRVYTTMATWCPSCLKHLPQIKLLKDSFSESELQLYGLPIDKTDSVSKLLTYQDENSPAYELIDNLSEPQRKSVTDLLSKHRSDALPSTIVTDSLGKVIVVQDSVPSISEIRRWLNQVRSAVNSKLEPH